MFTVYPRDRDDFTECQHYQGQAGAIVINQREPVHPALIEEK